MAEIQVLVPPKKSLKGTEQGPEQNVPIINTGEGAAPAPVEATIAFPPPSEAPSNANEFIGMDMPPHKSSAVVKKQTRREKLLERAMKPLVEKCIPDVEPRDPPEPREPLFPGLKPKKKKILTKDEERDQRAIAKRRCSTIQFRFVAS